MLKYKIDVLEELKGKGYTSYKLRKDKIMGEAQIQKIRQKRRKNLLRCIREERAEKHIQPMNIML